jgi:hypothetical protein
MLTSVSGGGNVIAYNFIPNTTSIPDWNQETAIYVSHASYSHSDLYEGNFGPNITSGNTWGNNGQIVFFRNHAWGRNLDKIPTQNFRAFMINGWGNYHASIGNVWLTPEALGNALLWDNPLNQNGWTLVVYRVGVQPWDRLAGNVHGTVPYDNLIDLPEGWAMSRFYRHFDFSYSSITALHASFNPVTPVSEMSVNDLPPSMYLTEAPEFFSGYTWPPVNPGGDSHDTRVFRLPAEDKWAHRLPSSSRRW